MITWEAPAKPETTCKNCGNTRDKHIPTSFAGMITNDFCPEPGHGWGSNRTIWRAV